MHNFTSVSRVKEDITNFCRKNAYGLILAHEIIVHIVMETYRIRENNPNFLKDSVEDLKFYFSLMIFISIVQKHTFQSS